MLLTSWSGVIFSNDWDNKGKATLHRADESGGKYWVTSKAKALVLQLL